MNDQDTSSVHSLRHVVSDDKATARLTLARVDLTVTAADLEWLAAALGQIRAGLEPAVPPVIWGSGARVFDLATVTLCDLEKDQPNSIDHGALLIARSPYFGWQQYVMDPAKCREMVAWMSGQREGLGMLNRPAAAH